MKKIIAILALIPLFLLPVALMSDTQFGRVITVTAGTGIRIVNTRTLASSLLVQMQTGGTGRGYVLSAHPDTTCTNGGAGTTLVAELSPASASGPGGAFTFPSNSDATTQEGGFDVQWFCVDGSHSADTIITSWRQR